MNLGTNVTGWIRLWARQALRGLRERSSVSLPGAFLRRAVLVQLPSWLIALIALSLVTLPAGQPLAQVGERSAKLTVYTEEWPPVSFYDGEQAAGMAVDVVREMLRRAELDVKIDVVPWARGYKQVVELPNVLLFAMGRTLERERLVTMIGPLVTARTEVYQKRGAGWKEKSPDEQHRAVVGTYRATYFETVAREQGFTRFEFATTPDRSARMLLSGRIDLWVDSSISAPNIVKVAGGSSADIEPVLILDVTELMLGISRGTPRAVVLGLEDALHAMKADGTYQRIFSRWFPGERPPMHVVRVGVEPVDRAPVKARP